MRMKVGNRLCSARTDRKMNQDEMAELLGVSTFAYARLERNETSAEIEQIANFSEILKIPLEEFLPEKFSIHNNSRNGHVGFVIGNIYNYKDDNDFIKELQHQNDIKDNENKFLREKVNLLKSTCDEFKRSNSIIEKVKQRKQRIFYSLLYKAKTPSTYKNISYKKRIFKIIFLPL